MLTVSYKNKDRRHELIVSGHCGYKPRGEDIYCAAASILLYTLVETLDRNDLSQEPVVVLESGDSYISVVADTESAEKIKGVFAVILNGFKILEKQGSEFIKMV